MKKIFLMLVAIPFVVDCTAQLGSQPTAEMQNFTLNQLHSKRMYNFEREDVEGIPFLTKDYKSATVFTKNGFKAEHVPVKVNVYNNEIIFKKNGEELALDSVKAVVYYDNEDDTTTVNVFQAGYPEIGILSSATIYQLKGGGLKNHFLKYNYKRLEPKETLGFYHLKEYRSYKEYYVYTPAKGMVKVKLNEKSITQALPGLESEISKIKASKKLNLSDEEDIAILFNELDKLPANK